jgi:hypothetical protein
MWHKVEYEATETPHRYVKAILPYIKSEDWYWNWNENGTIKIMFRRQADAELFEKNIGL